MKTNHLALLYDLASVPKVPFSVFKNTLAFITEDHGWGTDEERMSVLWLMLSKITKINAPLSKSFLDRSLASLHTFIIDEPWMRDPEFLPFLAKHFSDLLPKTHSTGDTAYDLLAQRMFNHLVLVPSWLPFFPHDVAQNIKVTLDRNNQPISFVNALFYKLSEVTPEGATAIASYFDQAGISVYEKTQENRSFLRHICTPRIWDMFIASGGKGTEKISHNAGEVEPLWKNLLRSPRTTMMEHVRQWAIKNRPEYQQEVGDMYIEACEKVSHRRPRLSDVQEKLCSHPQWYTVQSSKDGTTGLMHLIVSHDIAHKRVMSNKFSSYVAKKDHQGRSVVFYAMDSDTFLVDKMKFLMSNLDAMAPSPTQGGLIMQLALSDKKELHCLGITEFKRLINKHTCEMWFSCGLQDPNHLFAMFKRRNGWSSMSSMMVSALAQRFKDELNDPLVRGFVLSHLILHQAFAPNDANLKMLEDFAQEKPFAFPEDHSFTLPQKGQAPSGHSYESVTMAQTLLEKWALWAHTNIHQMPSGPKNNRKM